MGGLINLDRVIKIQADRKPIHLSQIGSLYKAMRHLPLPVREYHYSENAIMNLLSFAKLADVNDAIYVQSKDNGKYL